MRKKEGAKTVSLGDHFGKWCPFSEKRHQTVLIWLRIGRISALLQNGSKIVPQRALFYGPSNVHFGTVYFSQCILPSFHLDPLSFEYSDQQKCILSSSGDCRMSLYRSDKEKISLLEYQQTNDIFIDRVALAKQGDNRIGSVRPSVCVFVDALTAEPFDL